MTNRIRMSAQDAAQVGRRFRRTATKLEGARSGLRGSTALVTAGAGEFAMHLEDEARGLTATVRLSLDVYSEAADLIARNSADQWDDLERIDVRSGS